jgi:malonate transporter and related proteins
MPDVSLLLPDFLLIALGALLCRLTPLNRTVWAAVERLVYHLLFPALLFTAIVRQPLQLGDLAPLVSAAVAVVGVGIAVALALGRWPGVDARLHASGAQVAYRFNTYVALAVSERLAGAAGLAWVALLVAVCVPLVNVAAVWPLARQGGHGVARELVRNPLIVATVGGLAFNLAGLALPGLLMTAGSRIGSAALPLGLMAVGAGLQLGALREGPGLAAALLGVRHLLLPLLAIGAALAVPLPLAQQLVLVVFCAVPTSSSAYVLATRMGGHGGFVAGLVTVSTLMGMASLPLALWGLRAFSPP